MLRSRKYLLIGLIALNAAAAVLLALSRTDYRVDLSSVVEIWGDVVRDVDRFGRTITSVSVEKEIEIGNEMAKTFPPVVDQDLQAYIEEVGQALTAQVRRRGIPYKFHVIDWSVVNAFAVAGGHVLITKGMLNSIESEAELAGILAHEIAHVDLKHCIQQLQYELVLRRVVGDDLAAIAGIAQYLLTVSYSEQQEREADRAGMIMMAEAGYSPIEAIRAFVDIGSELEPLPDRPVKPERPELEIGRAIEAALGDYFETHPVWAERVRELDTILQRNMTSWEERTLYIGRSNYSDRVPRSIDHRSNETIIYSADLPELRMLRGELLSRIGNYDQAMKLFRKTAEQGFADAQYKLGVSYRRGQGVAKDDNQAVKWFRKAGEQGHVEAQHNLGGMYRRGQGVPQNGAEAVKWFQLAAEQGHAEAQYDLGRMFDYGTGVPQDDAAAVKWYRKAAEQGHAGARSVLPNLANRYFERGRAYRKKGQFDLAITNFTRAIEIDPDHKKAYRNRGIAREKFGQPGLAIADYTRAIEIDPKYKYAYADRGVAYRDQGKLDLAIADFTKAIEIDRNYKYAYSNRGLAYEEKDDLDRAIADQTKAIEIDPNYKYAYRRRGNVYSDQGKLDLSIADYTRGIEIDPNYKYAYNDRGFAYLDQGKLDLAIADINRAIEIDPDDARAYRNRGIIYEQQGDLDTAIADYSRAIKIDTDYASAYNNFAWLLATAPNSDKRDGWKAVELAAKAVALKPEDPAYVDTLAAAYAEAGQFIEAVRMQEQAIELLKAQGKEEKVSDFESRLKLYQQNESFRSQPPTSANQ